eukprot:355925_1
MIQMIQALLLSMFIRMMNGHTSRKLLDAPYFSVDSRPFQTWQKAKAYCQTYGARMATFHSLDDIQAMTDACLGDRYCYVGFDDIEQDMEYEFVTGETMDPLDSWATPNEPHNTEGWHCGLVWNRGQHGRVIYDGRCDGVPYDFYFSVVCEWAEEDQLECGEGSALHQIGDLNADISGDGIGQQYDLTTVQECMVICRDNSQCNSYSWAPKQGDANHRETTVCTLYETNVANDVAGPNQVLCRPCYKDAADAAPIKLSDVITRKFGMVDESGSYNVLRVSIAASVITTLVLFAVCCNLYCLFTMCKRKMHGHWEKVENKEE